MNLIDTKEPESMNMPKNVHLIKSELEKVI